jgi:mRNA interferase ChpB
MPLGFGLLSKKRKRYTLTELLQGVSPGIMTMPITTGGKVAKNCGLPVPITGHDTTVVAACNQVRSFAIEARVRAGDTRYIETLDTAISDEIVSRIISVIDPENDCFPSPFPPAGA